MQDLAELERRINAALQRIGAGIEAAPVQASLALSSESAADLANVSATADADAATIARLQAELAAERAATAQLRDEVQAAKAQPTPARPVATGDLQARVEQLTRQLDVQGLEMQRMRKNVVQLRESLRSLRRAASDKLPDPDMINRAMQAELESIRVTRFAEMAELDEIIAELDPLIAQPTSEVPEHA